MKKRLASHIQIFVSFWLLCTACQPDAEEVSHAHMLKLLKEVPRNTYHPENIFANHTRVQYFDSLLKIQPDHYPYQYQRALDLLRFGNSKEAALQLEKLILLKKQGKLEGKLPLTDQASLEAYEALAYLRLGEQENCIINHTAASCLFPIQKAGFHQLPQGSQSAIERYTHLLEHDPDNLTARWLLNVAYMTLGQYPQQIPEPWLIPDSSFQSEHPMKHFEDIASSIGFDFRGLSGGLVVDDFTNDGYLDIMISEWGQEDQLRFFVNNADGSFTEKTKAANLTGLFGGLNLIQADYNNDGWLDVFVLRGAWLRKYGEHPNSLLKNNGDGPDGHPTFTDVTQMSGLLSFHPTQTATWNDFNRDGWLDLFIGNETAGPESFHPCELFINQGGESPEFVDIAEQAGVAVSKVTFTIDPIHVKGVISGDYNNDGWPDIFVSTGGGNNLSSNFLFKNNGLNEEGKLSFTEVTEEAGLGGENSTFTSWFWDYNNDGWLDIFVANYWKGNQGSITSDIAAEYLGQPFDAATGMLYRNNQEGPDGSVTFTNVSEESKLDKILYAMGANFGDLDNDGWLDMYLGTGDPTLSSIIPNRMFRNAEGKAFQDVTTAAGVGHLQKGHAVSFSDIDNDGDQDILMSMGGAYQGDVFQNAFFENPYRDGPYHDDHHWISLRLIGKEANRSAIGTRLTFNVEENGVERTIHREVNSGGSFGASTLRVEVGLGSAAMVKKLSVLWPDGLLQEFTDLKPDNFYTLTQGDSNIKAVELKQLHFAPAEHAHMHPPQP